MTDAAVAVAGAWTTDPSRLPDELSSTFRAVMGWGGVAVWDESVDIVDLTREFAARTVQECCGQCFPCRIGMHEVADILERVRGKGAGAARASSSASTWPRPRAATSAAPVALRCSSRSSSTTTPSRRRRRKQPVPRRYAAPWSRLHGSCPRRRHPGLRGAARIDEVDAPPRPCARCPMPTATRVCVRPCEDAAAAPW
jgi:hypothetical protein